ncbi:MAG: methyltransferase domain-containing protein [Terriglobales bacterium]
MERTEYRTMYDFENSYWWYVARRQLVYALLKKLKGNSKHRIIMDVGCGTGGNEPMLADFGKVTLADRSVDALSWCRKRGLQRLLASNLESLPLSSGSVDMITALDVLEHTDDDLSALKEMYRVLKPGGIILVTVPAYGFLWSEHDEALHHRRRYTSYELRNKLASVNLDLQRLTYFITLLFFPIFAMRFWQNLFKSNLRPKTGHILLPAWLNWLLIKVLAVERVICCNLINFPFGVSVVAIARKPE